MSGYHSTGLLESWFQMFFFFVFFLILLAYQYTAWSNLQVVILPKGQQWVQDVRGRLSILDQPNQGVETPTDVNNNNNVNINQQTDQNNIPPGKGQIFIH